MDPAGAAVLRGRIEQQQHWQSAAAVREGRQPRVDPDLHALREMRGTERLYVDEGGSFAKRLVDGEWTRIEDARPGVPAARPS